MKTPSKNNLMFAFFLLFFTLFLRLLKKSPNELHWT